MDPSPQALRELARYLHNTTRLFPTPRTKKAFEWLRIKAEEAADLAGAWEADRKRFQALRRMYQERTDSDESEIDELIATYISAHDQDGGE
jgi:hypothetical protein